LNKNCSSISLLSTLSDLKQIKLAK
jgi:hypothetical protein